MNTLKSLAKWALAFAFSGAVAVVILASVIVVMQRPWIMFGLVITIFVVGFGIAVKDRYLP